MLRNICEWRERFAYWNFDYKSLCAFEYPARDAWMYCTEPFAGLPGHLSRTASTKFMGDAMDYALEVFLKSSAIFLMICCVRISSTFLADPISKIHSRLLDQPLYRRICEIAKRFLEQCSYLSSSWVYCVLYALVAQFLVFSHFAASTLPIPTVDILDFGPVFLLLAAGWFLLAAYKSLDSYLLNARYLYSLKWLSLIITGIGIILKFTGSLPSNCRIVLNYFALIHILRILSHFRNFRFGLEFSKLLGPGPWGSDYWWIECDCAYKPYNPWNFLERNFEIDLLGFGAFRFVPFRAFNLKYRWFVIATLPAVLVAFALLIWADDKHILLSVLNLLLLYLIAHTVLSTAQVILSMSLSVIPKLCAVLLSFMMLNTLIFFFTIPMSHVARFILEDPSQHDWSNIK